jgi:type II secretory pathway component GspD/PulD (secretin)
MRTSFLIIAAGAVLAMPLGAQRGGRGNPPQTPPAVARQTPDGIVLDFQDADIAVVLRAIAEAGNVAISLNNLPSVRTSLRVQQEMTRDAAIQMLKAVAEANGITVTETPVVLTFVGPPRQAAPANQNLSPAQQLQLAMQQRVLVLNIVRLKHATATTVAPMLMSLLTGTTTGTNVGRGAVLPGAGGIQAIQQGGGAANNAGGGRGGRGGGAAGGGAAGGGAAGGAAGGGAVAGGRGGGAVDITQFLGGRGGAQAAAALQALGIGQVQNLAFSDMRITADEATNSLVIRSTAEDFQAVQQLVQGIDVRPLQVLIEVTIAQLERSSDLNVGVSGSARKTTGTGAAARVDTQAFLPSQASARDFIAMITGTKGAVDYNVALNALQTLGNVRVLALPVIFAQNNRQAILNVGSQVPFVQVSQTVPNDPTGRVQTVQYINVGKQLTITPTINTDGYVNMSVTQTNDDVTNTLLFDAPIINSRQAQTQIFVRDGQTVVIGGMTDNTKDRHRSGIPFLSRLPLIGWAFGNTTQSDKVSEMYLFLTPHIVSSDQDIDRLRESVRSGSDMLQNVPIQGRVNPGGDTLQIGLPARPRTGRDTVIRRPPPDTIPHR